MDQIRQCMDNKEPSRVKFRRAEPDPPLLAVRLSSGISSPVYGALRIVLPPPKNLFIPFSLLQDKRYAPLVPPRVKAAFRKEMRKVRDSTRSGASADDTYTPTLWYFELMKFTAEQEQPRKTKSNLNEDEDEKR
ncbi:hypothetical protein J6590_023953 [Homalodisca vitripennis]|nr:hypothetical protein J6590_023953 [Homalodisca vitripennis]